MKENSISERWKEDTDGEQDLCRASGRYLTIMLTICLQGGKWDLTAASGSNRCSSTRTCARVGAICSPSDGSVIKAQLWGAARATQLEPQLITEDWQRRWARGQRWQTRLSDFVLFTLPLVNQKMNFILDCMPGQFAQCQNNVHGQPLLHLTLGSSKEDLPLDEG